MRSDESCQSSAHAGCEIYFKKMEFVQTGEETAAAAEMSKNSHVSCSNTRASLEEGLLRTVP